MAGFSFNIAKGREVELHNRVDGDDPTNSALIVVVLAHAGLEADDVLRDYDTLSAILAASNNEVTNTNYARKTLTQADLTAASVDDTTNLVTLPLATQTFTNIAFGDSWRKLLICYDSDTTGGTDANIIPVKAFDLISATTGGPLVPVTSTYAFAFPDGYHIAR